MKQGQLDVCCCLLDDGQFKGESQSCESLIETYSVIAGMLICL